MKIEISLRGTDPPAGGARCVADYNAGPTSVALGSTEGETLDFVGWLGLLGVLSDLLAGSVELPEPLGRAI